MNMIHYHGTPTSGGRDQAVAFLSGRHALIPYPRQDDLEVAAEVCQSFVFDNGAFSVWKRGGRLDVDGFTEWCDTWHRHPSFDWALVPDVIDGNEEENDALLRDWPPHIRGVPVWHLHESIDRLVRLGNEWPTVALGSSGQYARPGASLWWQRMNESLRALCDEHGRPPCRLHGLRMLDPEIFRHLPLTSADSTNAAVNAGSLDRFGIYKPLTAGLRAAVIASRIESYQSAPVWVPQKIQESLCF